MKYALALFCSVVTNPLLCQLRYTFGSATPLHFKITETDIQTSFPKSIEEQIKEINALYDELNTEAQKAKNVLETLITICEHSNIKNELIELKKIRETIETSCKGLISLGRSFTKNGHKAVLNCYCNTLILATLGTQKIAHLLFLLGKTDFLTVNNIIPEKLMVLKANIKYI